MIAKDEIQHSFFVSVQSSVYMHKYILNLTAIECGFFFSDCPKSISYSTINATEFERNTIITYDFPVKTN